MYANLSKEKLARADLQAQLDRMKVEHDKCPILIAALRKQIQETKDALDQDDITLEKNKDQLIKNSIELESKLKLSVAAPARSGRVKLGASSPGLALPLPSRDEEAVVQDKKLEAGTFSGIVKLHKELADIKKAHAPCEAALAVKDDHIKDLKLHLAKLDKDLHDELEKEEALSKQLAEEKNKEAELEQNLANTKAELLKDEASLAEDKKVFASKDAEIKDLKKRLAAAEKKHVPCDDLIASLRKQISALEMRCDYGKVSTCISRVSSGIERWKLASLVFATVQLLLTCITFARAQLQGEIEDLKKQLNDLNKLLGDLKKAHAPCPNIIAGLQSELQTLKATHTSCEGDCIYIDISIHIYEYMYIYVYIHVYVNIKYIFISGFAHTNILIAQRTYTSRFSM